MRLFVLIFLLLQGCTVLKPVDKPTSITNAVANPLPPEKTQELLEKTGGNWALGQGVGETTVTVGTIVAFPPYAIYVLGNAALSLAGYEQLYVTDLLPEKPKSVVNNVYDSVTEAPGKVIAAAAGKEFREEEVIQRDLQVFLADASNEAKKETVRGSNQ